MVISDKKRVDLEVTRAARKSLYKRICISVRKRSHKENASWCCEEGECWWQIVCYLFGSVSPQTGRPSWRESFYKYSCPTPWHTWLTEPTRNFLNRMSYWKQKIDNLQFIAFRKRVPSTGKRAKRVCSFTFLASWKACWQKTWCTNKITWYRFKGKK